MKLHRGALGRGGAPTFGALVSDDAHFQCVTLERSVDGDHPCIPAGTYAVHWATHHPGTPRQYRCPELDTAAIGRSCIHMHIANTVDELRGCIAVGELVDGAAIDCSEHAFERLMTYLEGVATWTLTIVDPG